MFYNYFFLNSMIEFSYDRKRVKHNLYIRNKFLKNYYHDSMKFKTINNYKQKFITLRILHCLLWKKKFNLAADRIDRHYNQQYSKNINVE